jgi:transposase
MSKQLDAVKKYVVRLSAEERGRLEDMIHTGRHAAGRLARARILLKADVSEAGEGWSDRRIMDALDVSAALIYDVRKQLVEEGVDAVLTRKKRERPPTPAIFDGAHEARLIALCCSSPPAGRARWTLRLLEKKVVELNIVEAASDSTIGRVLKKTSSNPIARNNGSFRPRRTRRS